MEKLLLLLLVAQCSLAFPINLLQKNKYANTTIFNTTCDQDSQTDFFFNSKSFIKCIGSICSLTQPHLSTMKFLNVDGYVYTLELDSAQFTDSVMVSGFGVVPSKYFTFTFKNNARSETLTLIVPIVHVVDDSESELNILNLDRLSDPAFSSLKSLSSLSSPFGLSVFNYLNLYDYCMFYSVSNTKMSETVLISDIVLNLPNDPSGAIGNTISFTPNYSISGDKLCYGAQQTSKMFETRMTLNWPLWTMWSVLLVFWLYNLVAAPVTAECFDHRFQNNKMTCWGIYSMHYLAHDEFFTRLSRESLMVLNFSTQAMILAALYTSLDHSPKSNPDYGILAWSAAIATAVTIPVPFIFGNAFLQPIYRLTIEIFGLTRRYFIAHQKRYQQVIEEPQLKQKQQKMYTLTYWYYLLIILCFTCFWVATVHMMMKMHHNYYYMHWFWLSSLGIAFVFEHLIYDPICSALFGNTEFYRSRGFYYNFRLGQQFKELQNL